MQSQPSLKRRPRLKAQPERPIPRTPSPSRKQPLPMNGLRPRRRTKPTICSTPRRQSFAASRRRARSARKRHRSPKNRPKNPLARTAKPGKETAAADERPQAKAADQTDDLLFPDGGRGSRGRITATPKAKPMAARSQAPSRKEAPSAGPGRQPCARRPCPGGFRLPRRPSHQQGLRP